MNDKEREKLKRIEQVAGGVLGTDEAARILRLTRRQVQRLLAQYRLWGDSALAHAARGRASNHAIQASVRERAKALLAGKYADFGPTLAQEHLADEDGSKPAARRCAAG